MKKVLTCLVLLLNGFTFCYGQVDSVRHRMFLLGDGGDLQGERHPVVDWLKKNVNWNDERNIAIWLGDNIYPHGLPTEGESDYVRSKQIMDYEISLVKGKKAKSYFIPGNHDWKNGKIGGWQRVQNQVDYINSQQLSNVEAWPTNGCPGPITVEVDSQLVIVLADSQWFLYVHDKPGPGSNCQTKSLDEFTNELEEIVNTHPNQLVMLAMHHPLYSEGVHGGAYTWKQHIFPFAEAIKGLYIPLPIIGSVYPLARGVFGTVQDFNHPVYRAMAKEIEAVLKKHPNTMSVAGHDHSQQLLMKDSMPFIVSGAVAELTRVRNNNKNLLYADVNYGFATVEVLKSGKVVTKFYNLQSPDLATPNFSKEVMTIKQTPPPVYNDSIGPLAKSVTVAANSDLEEGWLRNALVGRNYRKEWTQKVTVPVLDMSTEQGGLRPVRKGGGKQTKSLRLEDKTGKEWALRSIEKFPDAAIPADLRQTFAKDIVEQGVSASYPYASLSYSPFADATGVPHIRRKLVYVPNDPKLERFRSDFANVLAVLEEREPVGVNKTYNTDELVIRLAKDNDDHVDQKAVLKARLVDNFIMDFDRHEDQWRWSTRDTGKGKIYYPISRDHDQAFFVNQGILPFIGKKPWFVPEIQGFRAKAANINTFNRPARNFDRFFLTELSAEQWDKQLDTFIAAMTDDVIERALHQQPQEIQKYSAEKIINTLKDKRQYFKKDMMKYYRFISKEVAVVGSNDREQFRIIKGEDKTVQVIVNKIDKNNNISSKIYDRTFDPKVTHEVQLYGLSNNDRFIVEGNGGSPIVVRMIGGSGLDSFINNGKSSSNLRVYDVTFEENVIAGAGMMNKTSKDPQVNRFDRLNFKYNVVHPSLSFAYNVDDGLYLGMQAEVLHQGFRKEPYKIRHYLNAQRALRTASYRIRYEGDFTQIIGHEDLTVRADFRAPVNVTNFFGFGNYTPYDRNNPKGEQFYRIRYDIADVSVMLRRQLQSWMRVNYGLTYQYFNVATASNQGHLVTQPNLAGVDLTALYRSKAYAGLHLKLDIDSRDNKILPIRGLVLNVNARPMLGLNKYSHNVTRADIDMRIYSSLFSYPRFVFGTRFGYGHVFGKTLEIPQAYYLSGIENLRGFRRDRFAGQSVIYSNNELRFKISDFSTYLFPGSIGLHAFYDVGRVFYKGEAGHSWHAGYGGGIWLAPVKRFVITGSMAWSAEEKALPLITFGYFF
ncbi:MAG: hypothetical protein JWP88_465 [Flaviaesturariibacter sp.]|nr:hypothetical protein [Flaviaesturariibacter sp.]